MEDVHEAALVGHPKNTSPCEENVFLVVKLSERVTPSERVLDTSR